MAFAPGTLLTDDYQIEYGASISDDSNVGKVIGAGTNGSEIISMDIWSGTQLRTSDINRPLDDGQFEGEDLYVGRSIIVELEVWGATEAEFQFNWKQILAASRRRANEQTLAIRIPGWPDDFLIYCRPRRRTGLRYITESVIGFKAQATIEFYSTDPRIYGLTEQLKSGGLAVASGGLTFNAVPNLVFGSSGSSSILDCSNDGNFPTYATFTITGPVTNPSIENQSDAITLSLTGTVNTGETLVIDMQERTILLNGTTSRYFWLDDPTDWFKLGVGANDIVFRGTSGGSPTLEVTWRDAWA